MSQTITITKIQVILESTLEDGTLFRDAIYFTPEEHAVLDEKDIEAFAEERVQNYKAFLAKPREEAPPPTDEQKGDQLMSVDSQIEALMAQKAALETDLGVTTEALKADPAMFKGDVAPAEVAVK